MMAEHGYCYRRGRRLAERLEPLAIQLTDVPPDEY
jgi:hypothetical protein